MKIIVTGSSGMIGTALCQTLLTKNHEVIAVDVNPNAWDTEIAQITRLMDLTDSTNLKELPSDVDMIVHLAANARVHDLVQEPTLALQNINSTFNLLEFTRRTGTRGFVFASSREVYGSLPDIDQVTENMVDIRRCESPYTASKLSGEALIYSYQRVYGLSYVIVRLSNVYGRFDDSSRVVPTWIRNGLRGDPIVVYGPHKMLDFTYLDDTVDGLVRVVDRFKSVRDQIFNLSFGSRESLKLVAERLRDLTGSRSEIRNEESRAGELWTYRANLEAAHDQLGFSSNVGIEEGLIRAVSWYKNWMKRSAES